MFPNLLDRVKIILDYEFTIEHDDMLNEFIRNFVQMVNLYVGTEELPIELDFIVVECTVARYLRRGAEGFASESLGEISISYEDIITPYIPYLETYKATNKKVKFL